MASASNGHTNGNGHSSAQWSVESMIPQPPAAPEEDGVSGRKFVILAVIGVLLTWGAVYLGFRSWKANYEALAAYGETQVAPLIDPLANRVPADIEAATWKKAVADTHGMLIALTGSGMLDRARMEELGAEITTLVQNATPATALKDLSHFWDQLERRAGPVISSEVTPARPGSRNEKRHPRLPRPAILIREQPPEKKG